MKKIVILILIFFSLFSSSSFAHVSHYKSIKFLKYDLFLNNTPIGTHIFNFTKKKSKLIVNGIGNFKVSKLGINLINYTSESTSTYKGNQLIYFNSTTLQNDKTKYVNIKLKDELLYINGSSFKGKTDKNSIVSSLWNHEIVTKKQQISSISGRVIDQKVKFLGEETIYINNKKFDALKFHIFSNNNKPFNEKKLNLNIWYEKDTLLWLKASYKKMGDWEYRISDIKY